MYMRPHPCPHHAVLNLEGGDDEVLHIKAFGKDLGIEIRIDEEKTGVVISTKDGMHRQALDDTARRQLKEVDVGKMFDLPPLRTVTVEEAEQLRKKFGKASTAGHLSRGETCEELQEETKQ